MNGWQPVSVHAMATLAIASFGAAHDHLMRGEVAPRLGILPWARRARPMHDRTSYCPSINSMGTIHDPDKAQPSVPVQALTAVPLNLVPSPDRQSDGVTCVDT